MSETKPSRILTVAPDSDTPSTSERNALELKIAELTGAAEYLAQTIALSQGHIERLEKETEDCIRMKVQAEAELRAQEEINASRRRETHTLESEIKKQAATINHQQDSLRTLGETLDITERRYKQAIESLQSETDSKAKAIKHDHEAEKEKLSINLENHRNKIQAEMKILSDEMAQNRKKQQRALEIEFQDMKHKAEETIAKVLQDGRSKNEALIKATEATALEVHRESEAAAKRLILEANQKAADILRTAQHEAEEVRRRTHNAEVSFLKEKNSGLAELNLMVSHAKEEAQSILAAANMEASEIQHRVIQENEARIAATNSKLSQARKAADMEIQDAMEKSKAELARQTKEHEAQLARRVKETENQLAQERKRLEEETRSVVASARERAQALIETANNERNYKVEEIKALESSMFQSARQSAAAITHDAEKIALKIVEEARTRTRTVEKAVESIMSQAQDEAAKVRAKADAYADRIRRELPDPAKWESELAKIRQQEQERLQALIEPTVKNYLSAIDIAVNSIFMELPAKHQTNKVIQDFAEAIAQLQHRKNSIRFSDLIPKITVSQSMHETANPISHQPMKISS
ncbi:MAG TPA: hypothetical protein VE954_14870 [Oligoflexus sp.]|uniref:hypothetical protein n=1 Tax=Oligoflexus sp. TaxID=1971216 RepID=UPI002D22C8E2|nr:hypothetical protein [Oligoflexus sp.]HYX34384.1 hypothetical protein [Oligoflexus sp.]